jgi:tetratricopeptide (TPR) repeat protein
MSNDNINSGGGGVLKAQTANLDANIIQVGANSFAQQIQNFRKGERACPTPPPAPDHFGGRSRELQELKNILTQRNYPTFLAVEGIGGIGKTTLVRQLAHEMYRDKIFRAVLWLELNQKPDPTRLLLAWASLADQAFVYNNQPIELLAGQVRALLEELIAQECSDNNNQRILVVLDNVWDDDLETVKLLRSACPAASTIIVTSRSEEIALDFHAQAYKLRRVQGQEGVELVQEYLPEGDPAQLLELVQVLDGHPLALRLAARRLRNHLKADHPKVLQRHIAQYFGKMHALTQFEDLKLDVGENREDNLSLVLSFSYQELEDNFKAYFRALGVIPPGLTFDEAVLQSIWGLNHEHSTTADGVTSFVTLIIGKLRQESLLEHIPSLGENTNPQPKLPFRLHPLLQAYARALLHQANEWDTVHSRYVDFVIGLTIQFKRLQPELWHVLEPFMPHIIGVGDWLVHEINELEQNITAKRDLKTKPLTGSENIIYDRTSRFARRVTRLLYLRRDISRLAWLEAGLTAARRMADFKNMSLFLNEIGLAYSAMGDKTRALEFYQQKLPLARLLSDDNSLAVTFTNIGAVHDALGNKPEALRNYQAALPIKQKLGDKKGTAVTLNNIGGIHRSAADYPKALEILHQSLQISREVGDRRLQAATLTNIGGTYYEMGDYTQARLCYEQALPLLKSVDDKRGMATAYNNLGGLAMATGQMQQALEYYQFALPLRRAVGDKRGEANTLDNMAVVYSALGDKTTALEVCHEALIISQAFDDKQSTAEIFTNLGVLFWDTGNQTEAIRHLEQALQLYQNLTLSANVEKVQSYLNFYREKQV